MIFRRLSRAFQLVRLSPFTEATAQGRSNERYRRMALSTLAITLAKGVAALSTLVSVPLTIRYLGNERYGLWMTITSVAMLLNFADLGMGNGLVTELSAAHGRDDRRAASCYVSSAFLVLVLIALGGGTMFAAVYPFVSWSSVFKVTGTLASREAGTAFSVFLACTAIRIPLGVAQRVQMGYQEGYISSLWQATGALIGLIGLVIAIQAHAGLPWLVLIMSGGPVLTATVNWIIEFSARRPWLVPRLSRMKWAACRKMLTTGLLFLLLQVLALVGNASDNIIIAQVRGAAAVAGYSVVQKLFTMGLLAQLLVAPLWPAFGEALSRADYAWARRALNRGLAASFFIGAVVALPLVVFGQHLVTLWAGSSVMPSHWLLIGFGLWVVQAGYVGVMSAFLNNSDLLVRQIWFYAAASLIALILKIFLTQWWGVAGTIWATVIAYGSVYAVPAALLAYRYLSAAAIRQLQDDSSGGSLS